MMKPLANPLPKETTVTFASVTPIASGDPHLVPEALFISALLDSGIYNPEKFKVLDHYFSAHRQVHEYCKQHQADTGTAPTVNLVRRKFKTFPYMQGVQPIAAAKEVKNHWQARHLRKIMSNATVELNSAEFDARAAFAILQDGLGEANVTSNTHTSFADLSAFEELAEVTPIPVSLSENDNLNRFTGGIHPGNLWYVAAGTGVGKSWQMCATAVAAAEAGFDVWFYSTEMTRVEVQDRLHRYAFRDTYKGKWADLDLDKRRELAEQWQSTAGAIEIVDPTQGPLSPSVIAGNHTEGCLAVVDYVGYMYTNGGQAAIEDWRVISQISIQLKEAALAHNIPIVCAAQLNKEGASKGSQASKEHMAQAYQLARDADVILSLSDYDADIQTRVRVNKLLKNRHGAAGHKWFTLLDIEARDFRDISYEAAQQVVEIDTTAKSIGF